jgi:single-strand DNA-binding protein
MDLMANLNKVMLMGNLTRDVQLSYLPSQTAVAEFGLAINRKFKKQDGTQGEEVCFVDCQMFGKRADVLVKYLKKGDPIFLEGHLKFDSWQGQDGSKHSRLRVMIENFEFLGGRTEKEAEPAEAAEPTVAAENKTQNYDPDNDDEIPF